MKVERLFEIIGSEFYTGVPDSQLKSLNYFLYNKFKLNSKHHIIASNEGNCVALATGYYLSTGNIPVVYMQNSGIGNAVNPILSLISNEVYDIPMIFIIGWRGEPGVKDEPQHIHQGKITVDLLKQIGLETFIIDKSTTEMDLEKIMNSYKNNLLSSRQIAFVVKKEALTYGEKLEYNNNYTLVRENCISEILNISGNDIVVSTTGKISREVFETREKNGMQHEIDFLTMGSMGHTSSIAFSIALNKTNSKVWCIDGDGSAIMHLGAMAVIGNYKPKNLIHIILNNEAHESVGGLPTVSSGVDFVQIAKGCGYEYAASVDDLDSLRNQLRFLKTNLNLSLLEIKCSLYSREDLRRPDKSPKQNKENFMKHLEKSK